MITTVTLNPALDKIYTISNFTINKLHRLGDFSRLFMDGEIDTVISSPGGKGINVAVFTQRMGIKTMAMGIIGGHAGRLLEDLVIREGITINCIYGAGNTRTNLSIFDTKSNTLTVINEPGNPILEEDLDTFLKRFSLVVSSSQYIIISGSIPPGTDPDFYAKLINISNAKKVPVILNTLKTPLLKGIEAGPTIVYPDLRSDYTFLDHKTETREDYFDLGQIVLTKHKNIKIVIFSKMTNGQVFYITRQGQYEVTFNNLKIANLFGFGDQLIGGLTYALVNNMEIEDALKYASAAGLTNAESLSKFVTNPKIINNNINRVSIIKREG
ncbi:MAG TPA: hypothetical protein DF296_09440 [Candidatus Margulisbacteria bacterium]|nr:MAG: hypothetical protein A2X43_07105 [Candidatus Margulisbacteria bacterium GWD2_39_127]OGI02952.1 MAG: hypothetical protein A2X42_12730 [Candidatus Margulisbacteria bacterium GWF2_38_17]OGI09455.1 MAG: hypothetical protein A2X41_12515 [Candidatus Margulisbacteria bacterium GWE2_39_32]HAR63353.1 hypothetical protein [Candidatus Margulisiibacteriota bacterium]HCT85410.1 hypothetical protein [Candidatus Margulisiibacteriota bacterium]